MIRHFLGSLGLAAAVVLTVHSAEATTNSAIRGTWSCNDVSRPHTAANAEVSEYRPDGSVSWSAYGQHQKYRYTYTHGILTLEGEGLPGLLKSRIAWHGNNAFSTTPGADQVAQTCHRKGM